MKSLWDDIQSGRGETKRDELGIDGTAGDAQDVRHPLFQPEDADCCLVCGLSPTARVHR